MILDRYVLCFSIDLSFLVPKLIELYLRNEHRRCDNADADINNALKHNDTVNTESTDNLE